ncbi:GH39 family glycosyl hydrolase [Eisenbergiella tayi]|uniref:GH39 family glycosyl hydrolase n=1 Tax=Eisenbergiella tayi TaxID=1432052 RepID=UPI0004BC009A|nr:hypothetical protein [Eisenbergiella tayi]
MHRTDEAVIVRKEDGSYRGIVWNMTMDGTGEDICRSFRLPMEGIPSGEKGECCILTKTVDEVTCNPLKLWHAMGEPSSLSGEQKKLLKEGARPLVEAQRKELEDGMADVCITVRENGVVYFEVFPVKAGGDRGYCYKRAVGK